ncbi:aromatic compound degradation protein PaaI [Serinibacter arcticus]|uniref:Aromatic compound degradation protein PaaI n=1 Tax=Serinibacter arcticus TaxID=1655435 RepID=A0A2U1ZRP2_9MICO|nr:hotdog fold thioesterase [Serinibacter arcticus]PWD49620.1 aromatic compound degradation protein PaaI [Serinibacter arcticus]
MSDIETPDLTGTLMERLGMELSEISAQGCTGTMPVAGNTQPYGLLHGGATAALAETVGSVAAQQHAGPGRAAVGLELSVTHHRAARSGTVRARATAVHLGRSSATYLVEVTDEAERRISSARLTCLLLDGASGSTTAGAAGNSAGATPS